jgi:hypothetical protein
MNDDLTDDEPNKDYSDGYESDSSEDYNDEYDEDYEGHSDNDEDYDQVIEIRNQQRDLLEQLEDLVREFNTKFKGLNLPFIEFLNVYWSSRMREVMRELAPRYETEAKEIERLGVVLDHVYKG